MSVRPAEKRDVDVIMGFIKELAEYESLAHEVVADELSLERSLFDEYPVAEALIAEFETTPIGFALGCNGVVLTPMARCVDDGGDATMMGGK